MGSAPSSPNPQTGIQLGTQVANQQQGINTGTGIQNQAGSMVNQSNPYASLGYTQTGVGPNGTPIYTATTNLSPAQQQLLNQLQGTQTTAGGQAGNLLTGANYGVTPPSEVVGNMASGLEGQMMAGYQQEMQPIQKTQRDQLDTQLRNQGGAPGDKGLYDNAMRTFDTNITNANAGVAANYAGTAFNQANTLYQEPAAMAESLARFGGPNTGAANTWANAPGLSIQPANLIGATANEQQALMDQYKAQMDKYSGMMNGLFGIGADALGVIGAPFTGGASLMLPAMMGAMGGGGAQGAQQYGNGEWYPSFGA